MCLGVSRSLNAVRNSARHDDQIHIPFTVGGRNAEFLEFFCYGASGSHQRNASHHHIGGSARIIQSCEQRYITVQACVLGTNTSSTNNHYQVLLECMGSIKFVFEPSV